MFKQTRVFLLAAVAALSVSACGGGSLGGTPDDGIITGPVPATLTLLASTPQLSSDAATPSKGVTLTAIVKDKDNVVIPDVPVVFSTQDSAELTVPNPAATDNTGRVQATLTTGGDPQNRTITVKATAGTLSKTLTINVIGTTLEFSGPDSTQINAETPYTVLLTEADGAGIPNTTIQVTTDAGNTIAADSFVTDGAGQVSFTLKATRASTTLTAVALGMTSTKAVTVSTDEFSFTTPAADQEINIGATRTITARWFRSNAPVANGTVINFTATRGQLSAPSATTVSGLASVTISSTESGLSTIAASSTALSKPSTTRSIEFVAIVPASVEVQASPANIGTNQSSEITAIVRDPSNNLVKNQTVDFALSDLTAGNISAASAVTNSQGVAKITYTASSQTSASRGVEITGRVRGTSIADQAVITVGVRAVDITIGTGSEIIDKDEATYQLPFTVVVADSSGNPVPDADFTLSYVPTRFIKGFRDTDTGTVTDTALCDNEDVNLNDIDDPSEDVDNDGQLEPGRIATVPSTVTLDPEDGSGRFLVTYPKDRGQWVEIMITGTATVSGTSTTETRTLFLRIAEGDEVDLPSRSPYGVVGSCSDPN